MIKLTRTLKAWGTGTFRSVLLDEIGSIEHKYLPLQEGLSLSSYVSDFGISVLLLKITETSSDIIAKIGIFYAGVIVGSCCADDPTPVCEQTEYCEVQFNIKKITAEATIVLLSE
ncbi:hypothetical protein MNBD_GAMMA12-2065 [hydrothermal vent metagenome]|uniref:Uncharacterized protein n=1 Tax=hydrothermal vent metagenome TaxID=652676 RepID=A0A3B0YDB7_9ZZZZ